MNKKQFSKQFNREFTKLHDMMGGILENADPMVISALAAVCSDAMVFCLFKITNGDMEETAKAVSRAVNISLEATRKNL